MPLVEITYAPDMPHKVLRKLAEMLPHAVSVAVECPEEPYDGDLQPGDVERAKWFESRAENRQERADGLCEAIGEATGLAHVGVYLRSRPGPRDDLATGLTPHAS